MNPPPAQADVRHRASARLASLIPLPPRAGRFFYCARLGTPLFFGFTCPHPPPLRPLPASGYVVWLTGLPAAGKTTLATRLEERLQEAGQKVVRLDGDTLRQGLCSDLGFSPRDREENIRRAAEVARVVADHGQICVAALISPLIADRGRARRLIGERRFVEVYLATPVRVCRERDVKGNYVKADRGEIADFTGVSAPYEVPPSPAILVSPHCESVDVAADRVLQFLTTENFFDRRPPASLPPQPLPTGCAQQ